MQLLWPLIFYSLLPTSLAVLLNVTVDDTHGDPKTGQLVTYIPADQWLNGPTCSSCPATSKLNMSTIYNETWHNGVANNSPNSNIDPLLASISFYGSAVYVYCIVANTKSSPNGNMDLVFLIDSQPAGSFSREPSGDNTFLYNVPVYANASLIHDNHTLTIQNGHVGGPKSLVLLDYIVYSYDDGLNPSLTASDSTFVASATATSSSSDSPMASAGQGHSFQVSPAGKIVGGILGTLAVVLLALLAFLWYRQRNSKTLGISNPFNTPSKPRNLTSILKIQSWWRNSATMSRNRMSFNPSLLAEPVVMNNKHASANTANVRRPPPVTTIQPLHLSALRHDSLQPLQPNRDTTPTPPPLDARNEPSQPLSIVEWQRRTQREADDIPPRLDVSDVEMSSYYDFSSDAPEQPPPHIQPRATTRRFTVVNV